MSKTVDDLVKVFNRAKWDQLRAADYENLDHAGIAAVVRALRDELSKCDWDEGENMIDALDEILGDAGAEKVAGGPRPEAMGSAPSATDPAPAPCLWRVHHETRNGPLYVSQCDGEWRHATADPKCPSCGKPIKFTEAK